MKEYAVYKVSGCNFKDVLATFETLCEAQMFCDNLNWEFEDENGFVWDLLIVQIIYCRVGMMLRKEKEEMAR